ncbi:MAG: HAMP domain-containing protein [Alphaproteobacteria bacterium]|nr:HAMP domain-containing protein [Alphaproteobacteria bacterium]
MAFLSPNAGSTLRTNSRRLLVGFQRAVNYLQGLGLRTVADILPKGLYARALIIIIAPIVVLEGVVAFVFMERHWQAVTSRLSEATARDIAAVIQVYEDYPRDDGNSGIIALARDKLNLQMSVLQHEDLPPARPKPFFDLLDRELSRQISKQINRPYWIDTVGQSHLVEIRVKHDDAILRFVARRTQTYASNSEIFLAWMVGSSVILLTVAIMFLRNQIKPILRLAQAADAFGKGRPEPPDFRPRGAREVRQAAQAFLEMRERITTHVDQRTTMLAGVSHDLRTVLTRFKLQLALLDDTPEAVSLRADVDEMQHMLEDYLAFARGHGGEEATPTGLKTLLKGILEDASVLGVDIRLKMRRRRKDIVLPLKRHAIKRAIWNLVSNAARFSDTVIIRAATERRWLRIEVDDDGPGIPLEERDNVFEPFYRLDVARNQDKGNTGLGLAIARDIARNHGGDITLGESSMGGLRAIISIPL